MATSDTEVCNRAIVQVGGTRLADLTTDDTKEGVVCRDNYYAARNEVLAAAEWPFALARAALVKSATETPAWEYSAAYAVPTDQLRILIIATDSYFTEDRQADWVQEGQYVLVKNYAPATLYAKYIKKIEDPSLYSPHFEAALVMRMASYLARPIANSKTLQDQCYNEYMREIDEAAGINAQVGRSKRMRARELIDVRGHGGGAWMGPTA